MQERKFGMDAVKRKRGRPKLPPELRRSKRSYVYVSEQELAQMRARAASAGVSVMALVRRSLITYMGWSK